MHLHQRGNSFRKPQRRSHLPSRLQGFVRLSYGPTLTEVEEGLDRLERLCRMETPPA